MDRILRSLMQVGGYPEVDEALQNWMRLQEYELEYPHEEDRKIYQYLKTFYNQMSAPPDFTLVRDYFEKQDEIEVCARLEEIKKAQPYIRTNFLSVVRSEQEQQQVKSFILAIRDASAIAEHGRNLEKPIGGKKVLKGVNDAINFLYEKMSDLSRVESGEKLEGVVSDDAEEFLEEYEKGKITNKFAGRNIIGLEPVDAVCKGHRSGEFWVHCAAPGELKCVVGSSTVYDHETKRRWTFKEMYEKSHLPTVTALSYEGRNNSLTLALAKASHIVQNGIRPVFELQLSSGRRTTATSNHPFYTPSGWVELNKLSPGDWVAVPRKMNVTDPNHSFTDAEVKAVGYLIGDGYIGGKSCPTLTASNDEIRSDFMQCLRDIGMKEGPSDGVHPCFHEEFPKNRAPGVRVSWSKGNGVSYTSPLIDLLESLSVIGKVAASKSIPDEFFGLPEEQISLLLGALWSTDRLGHIGDHERNDRLSLDKRNDISYHSTSEDLCRDVQSLLLRLGIKSTVTSFFIDYGGPYEVFTTRVVGSRSKRLFIEKIRVIGKESKFQSMLNRLRKVDDDKYPTCLLPDGSSIRSSNGRLKTAKQLKKRQTITGETLKAFSTHYEQLQAYVKNDVVWEQVKQILPRGKEMTYDMSVPEHKSFVVDDIISHNTTLALNYAYNNAYLFGRNIFYGIFEMPYKQLRRQLYVVHSSHGKFVTDWYEQDRRRGLPPNQCYVGLDYQKVRDFELDDIGEQRLKFVAQDFKATCLGKLYIWRPASAITGTLVEDVYRRAEMFHNKWGCDGIILDHMGWLRSKHRTTNTVDAINNVVSECRMMALSFARGRTVPVLGLYQINRQGKVKADKEDGRYGFESISYANRIEQDADVITYTYLNPQLRKDGKFYLGCMKNRDNAIFDRMIGKIIWQSKRMRHIEAGLLDKSTDQALLRATTLTMDDMLMTGT